MARSRSTQSLRFETVLRAAAAPGAIPQFDDVDFSELTDLMPWIAVVDPNSEAFTLTVERAGESLAKLLGFDPVGIDYLSFVDPAIKGEAFDSTFVMLSRPCGLWQITPALTVDGREVFAELTAYPVFDEKRGRGLIIAFVHQNIDRLSSIALVKHSTEWCWLDLRGNALNSVLPTPK